MKKLFNKSIAMLITMTMLLGMFGTMNVFAEITNSSYATANFDDASTAEGNYTNMSFAYTVQKGNKIGTVSLVEDAAPYYDTMLKFEQTASSATTDGLQFMDFSLTDGLEIGENVAENTYAEFSVDVKLQNKTTGINLDLANKDHKGNTYMYRLQLTAKGVLGGTSATLASGSNDVFCNLRIRVDLKNKTVVGVYANDELVADLSASPIAMSNASVETIDRLKISIGKNTVTDTLYVDNVSVVTYTSTDGTSPVASKVALRSKILELSSVALSGNAKTVFDNAVALAKNPAATQSEVDSTVSALNNLNTSGLPEVAGRADFDSATTAEGTYKGMSFEYKIRNGNKLGTVSLEQNAIPYYDKMIKFDQTSSDASTDDLQYLSFTLDEGLAIGENASENTYAEFSADVKLSGKTTGINLEIGNTGATHVGKYMYRLQLNAKGVLSSTPSGTSATLASGSNGVFCNLRIRVDLKNKTVVGVYADDELVADLSESPIAMQNATVETIDRFNILIGKKGVTDTLYIDNVNVVTYVSADGTSPIASKAELRAKMAEIYSMAQSETAKKAMQNAALYLKAPAISQADIDSALANLTDVAKIWLKEDIFVDGIYYLEEAEKLEGLNDLKASTDINAKVYYSNPSDEDKTILCVIGYYDSCGTLIDVSVSESIMMTESARGSKDFKFTTPKDVSDISGVKVFVMESLLTLTPVSDRYFIFDDRWTQSGTLNDDAAYNLVTTFYGDEGTTRGFAWSAVTEHTDMAIRYAKTDAEWYGESIIDEAVSVEYDGKLYYKVDIDNLEPGESYVYKIGDMQDDVWSDFYTFTTEPENLAEFSFIGVTDPQSNTWSGGFEYYKAVLDEAFENDTDASFMVNLGDMVNHGNEQSEWDGYFKATKGYVESIPHMAVMGNHETRGDSETAGKNFSLQFNNPQNGADAFGNLTYSEVSSSYNKGVLKNKEGSVYSFDYGNAHFVVLNSGYEGNKSDTITLLSEQAKWLKEDLNSSDKKWKIVMVHIGLYPAKTERYDSREALLSVIDECKVDLVLQGHDHMVARTYPMRGDEIVSDINPASVIKGTGTIYNILGSAGPKRYAELTEIPSYMAFLEATERTQPTYSVFDVSDERISVITKQIDGTLVDSFEIIDAS